MPVTYLAGMQGLAWPLVAVVLSLRLLRARTAVFPWTTVPLVVFVGWALLSIATIDPSDLPIFGYRWLLFLGTLVILVWVANLPRSVISTDQVVDWLAWLWIATAGFGIAAQFLSSVSMPSPTSIALGPIGRIEFIARISDWHLADNQEFQGSAFARPAAPWAAANSWGAAMGILTPFFVRSWLMDASVRRRRIGRYLLAGAAIPIVMSANRGLWIGLVAGLVYFTARRALRGRFSAIAVLVGAVAVVGVLVTVTPAGGLIESRISGSSDSDRSRSRLYVDAFEGARVAADRQRVPPRTDYYPNSPPVGTHGLLWYLMFIHGFVGLALFGSWLVAEVFRSGRVRAPVGWCLHVALVIGLIEVPYYGLQPHVMILGIAAGLVHRERLQPLSGAGRGDRAATAGAPSVDETAPA